MEADGSVERAIVKLLLTKNPEEIETLADDLGAMGDRRAVGPLASRLADNRVHDDPDLEEAVCSSLVRLGAMGRRGQPHLPILGPPPAPPPRRAATVPLVAVPSG